MAQTDAGKKKVHVPEHRKADGTKVSTKFEPSQERFHGKPPSRSVVGGSSLKMIIMFILIKYF